MREDAAIGGGEIIVALYDNYAFHEFLSVVMIILQECSKNVVKTHS